jgi:hypothetical protein
MINIGIGISWAKAIYSVANNVIANFKARVLADNGVFEAGPCLDATLEGLNAIGLLDNASLIITPNAYNTGILYDVIPNTTLGDMDVVRATTATRVNASGLIESVANNVPRLDYLNASCPSILVEPQRTNVLTYSEALTPNFTFNQCSITSNQISPNGTNNAKRITNGATATDVYFEQSVGIAVNTYTWSACVKKGTDTSATIKPVHVGIGGDVSLMTFTFATETIVTSGVITTSGFTKLSNGWYRIFCTVPITLAVISLRGRFGNSNTPNVYNEWFGVQLEQGNYPTSYIPTTTATVTRNADLISKTGITSLIGQTEGTVFLNLFASAQNSDSVPGFSVLCDIGTGTNRIQIYTNNGYIGFIIYNPGALVIASAFSITPNTNIKVALGYSSGATSMFVNGTQVATTAAALSLSGLDAFTLNKVFGADLSAKNNYNSAILFKTRLTNAELATLTTI